MRLHLVALPHTQVRPESCGCAYTAKILKFCKMMSHHDIFLYAPEGPAVEGAMLLPCLTDARRQEIFGVDDPNRLPAWPTDIQTAEFNLAAIHSLKKELQPHDFILLAAGRTHLPIAEAFPNHIILEPGVGYYGILPKSFCAFESYAHMHTCYEQNKIHDIRWFDTVIPNYFDENEFPVLNRGGGEYLAFLGRLIGRKGPHIASDIAKAAGMPLRVAGAGGKQVGSDIVAAEITVKDAEYIGPVNVKERAQFLAGARALIVPTTYMEPFGGVAVEAMICGTPVIASDAGAFTEIVKNGVSGYRFRTLQRAVDAVKAVENIPPGMISAYAMHNFSLQAVRPKFDQWFDDLSTLWGKGWYQVAESKNSATLDRPHVQEDL